MLSQALCSTNFAPESCNPCQGTATWALLGGGGARRTRESAKKKIWGMEAVGVRVCTRAGAQHDAAVSKVGSSLPTSTDVVIFLVSDAGCLRLMCSLCLPACAGC